MLFVTFMVERFLVVAFESSLPNRLEIASVHRKLDNVLATLSSEY